ncbi:hypothetical protein ACFS7Z_08665 [Pontibacter toksunensis]|uniref:Uncharacterized protein n=1 Tax=Pontibacter toksunensis TaxID=1332631 RepID=A0ABW6BRF4_9BACT
MTKKQLKEALEALAAQNPQYHILLIAKCEDSLFHKQEPIWMKDDYVKALRFMRQAPDCELHYLIGEQNEAGNNKQFKIIKTLLLIAKKSQSKIDAIYARNSQNLKYTDDDYVPLPTDVLEIAGSDSIPMSELVLYASRTFSLTTFSKISKQKIYRHLGNGAMYCLNTTFHVKNLIDRLSAGERAFTSNPTKLEVYVDQKSDKELIDIGFAIQYNEYKIAKRKFIIGDFLIHD